MAAVATAVVVAVAGGVVAGTAVIGVGMAGGVVAGAGGVVAGMVAEGGGG
jgi:hypothetical protein